MSAPDSMDAGSSPDALAGFKGAVAHLEPLSLTDIQLRADLQTRLDRKYLAPPAVAQDLVHAGAGRLEVLQIGNLRTFDYESVYFDTPDLDSFHGAAHSRRRRFKVRTRAYLDSGLCVLEIKTTGGRDETIKVRRDHPFEARHRLGSQEHDFIAEHLPGLDPRTLRPALSTLYSRTTLLGRSGARMTFDAGLRMQAPGGPETPTQNDVVIETKSPGAATPADRWLWNRGLRPIRVSKYAIGLAYLFPHLPANKWNRTLRTHFGWSPEPHRIPA